MEDLNCPICLEYATEAKACPHCSKVFCNQCLNNLPRIHRNAIIHCPHCRLNVNINQFIKLNFVDDLLKESAEKDRQINELMREKEQMRRNFEEITTKERNHLIDAVADKCEKHPRKQKSLYCTTCHVSMCCDCRHDHPFDIIEDAYAKASSALMEATTQDAKIQSVLDMETNHFELVNNLRKQRETLISNLVINMRRTHEEAIREKSADVEAAFAQLRTFKSAFKLNLNAAKTASESPMLNRLADKQSTLCQQALDADLLLGEVSNVPAMNNLLNGLPSVNIDTFKVLGPWLGDMTREQWTRVEEEGELHVARLFCELPSPECMTENMIDPAQSV